MQTIIYVLVNEAMPGLVKIGCTSNLRMRMDDLYTTGVPLPFDCFFAAEVEDARALEKKLHFIFEGERVNPGREYFRTDPERVVRAISIGMYQQVVPDDATMIASAEVAAAERARAKRSRINLRKIGIYSGETLVFSRSSSITCVVSENNRVLYGAVVRQAFQTRHHKRWCN